jgi:hypothetical protein
VIILTLGIHFFLTTINGGIRISMSGGDLRKPLAFNHD